MSVTFVSAYYYIKNNAKSSTNYLTHFKNIPLTEIPFFILFTNEKTLDIIKLELNQYFKNNNYCDKIKIIVQELNLEKIIQQEELFVKPNNKKFTDEYITLGHHKIEFLKQASQDNYFETEYFAWMDFGISHVSTTTSDELREIILSIQPKIKLCCIDFFPTWDLTNKKIFYSKFKHYIAAGLITGSAKNILELYQLYKEEYNIMISLKVFALEEAILSVLVEENPNLFDLYFGGYCCLFRNYIRYVKAPEYILDITRLCINAKQYDKGCKFLQSVIRSLHENKLTISKKQLSLLVLAKEITGTKNLEIYVQLMEAIIANMLKE